jgi:hypothetical protein
VPEQLSDEARQKLEDRQAFIQKVTSIKTNEQKMLEALEAIRDTLNVLVAMARAQATPATTGKVKLYPRSK